jgi:SAM-dependent methyltransferase
MSQWRVPFICPTCRGTLDIGPRGALCSTGHSFVVENAVPHLVAGAAQSARQQATWFDEADAEWEIERPDGAPPLHRWLLEEKFRRSVDNLELSGADALVVCAGSGMDAEFLSRAGARVAALDISPGAVGRASERARRHGFDLALVVGDATRLPFPDHSIDVVYVHDGLHHIDDPETAIAEMVRVARNAVCINEPAAAGVTAFAVRAGLALEREDAGNRVARLDLESVCAFLRRSDLTIVRANRYAMYYKHEPGLAARALSRPGLFGAARVSLRLANLIIGRYGNKLTVVGLRRAPRDRATLGGTPLQR